MKHIITVFLIVALGVSMTFQPAGALDMPNAVVKISMAQAIEAALGSMEDIKISVVETEKAYHGYHQNRLTKDQMGPDRHHYQWFAFI